MRVIGRRGASTRAMRLLGLSVTTLAAGCAHHYTAGMRPADKLDPGRAYFYGHFGIYTPRMPLAMDGYQTMGFVMRCGDGTDYKIRFSIEKQVQVIAAKPARCVLGEVIYTNQNGLIEGRKPVHDAAAFDLAAGTAYYLGDYLAKTNSSSELLVFSTLVHYVWEMTEVDDNYDATTAEMRRLFPTLAGLATQNRMLVPLVRVRHVPLKRSGPEVVVSPERAARLAGFTKRRYATRAACEEACPATGGCFPFMSGEVPATTCVVRCKTDKDCPKGLACNCPDGDGAACRGIAVTPEDPMDGICLSVEPAAGRPSP